MKNSMIKKQNKDHSGILESLLVIVCSLIAYRFICSFEPNPSLVDDNATQWIHVIVGAYQTLLKEGYLPFVDFFQMKGLNILDVGYYQLLNPFMFLSFLVSKVPILHAQWNVISIYILIMVALGNLTTYKLLKLLKIDVVHIIVIVASYTVCSPFIVMAYWNYVYGSYLIIPLLLYVIVKYNGKPSMYFNSGIILAVSINLGNIQYTIYQYIAFFIMMLMLGIGYQKKYFKALFTNIVVAFILSLPQLVLILRASQRSGSFSGGLNEGFFANAINPIKLIIFGVIPSSSFGVQLEQVNASLDSIFKIGNEYWGGPAILFMGGLLLGIMAFIGCYFRQWLGGIIVKKSKIQIADEEHFINAFAMSSFTACVFFVIFVFGQNFGIANMMSFLPVIRSLRYLQKILIILPSLMLIPTALALKYHDPKKYLLGTMILCLVLGYSHDRESFWKYGS